MTQVSLGDYQHVWFTPTFFSRDFKIISNYYIYLLIELLHRLAWLMFSSSPILLDVPCPALFPQSSSSLPVQGKQEGTKITMKALWILHKYYSHFPSHLSMGLLPLFFTVIQLLYFSVHLQVSFSSHVSPVLLSSAMACSFSDSHCLCLHSCLQEHLVTLTCLQAHRRGWEEDLRCWQPSWQWVLGWQWGLLSLCSTTSCWQLLFPLFRNLAAGNFDQAPLLLAHTWVFVLDAFLFWAAQPAQHPAHPFAPSASSCICQLPGGCRVSGLMGVVLAKGKKAQILKICKQGQCAG